MKVDDHLYPSLQNYICITGGAVAKHAADEAVVDVLYNVFEALQSLMLYNPYVRCIDVGGNPGRIPPQKKAPEMYNRSLNETILSLIPMLEVPEPWYRVQAIQGMMLAIIEHHQIYLPANAEAAFDRIAETDPDPLVREWASFALDPHDKEMPKMPEIKD